MEEKEKDIYYNYAASSHSEPLSLNKMMMNDGQPTKIYSMFNIEIKLCENKRY